MEEEIVAPSVDLLESMRSVGYSLEAAVADLVDNSLTARATSVLIDADVIDGKYIAILDDGEGMSPETSREALRLAGSVGDRSEFDLGRFGLGLKTASLSQARSLTVVSKAGGQTTGLRWDIDHVRTTRQWSLIVLDPDSTQALPLWPALDSQKSGTLVVWQRLDLLLGDSVTPGALLAERLGDLRAGLSLTFHRFLRGGKDGFAIRVNGIDLKPIDPFLSTNPRTQVTLTEIVAIAGSEVEVTGYTLPHASGLSPEERGRRDLGDGMRDAQGFYVYRNRRLISHGHWYGLARVSELSKQTRVRVDVPAALDSLWQLDIKKSRAEPPPSFKAHLRRLIDPLLDRGRRVHTYRGRKEGGDKTSHVWSKIRDRSGFRYEVNVENPVVQSALALLSTADANSIITLFQTLAENYPLLDVYQEMAGNTVPVPAPQDPETIVERLRQVRKADLLGADPVFVYEALRASEPFNSVADLESMIMQVWKDEDDTH